MGVIQQMRGRKRMSSHSIFRSQRASVAGLLLLSVLSVSVALADDGTDPPGRVARLSYTNGSVSLQPAGVEDWAEAIVNRPLTTGDKLWTDRNSRAELDMGSAAIRLGSTTGFSFLNLDDHSAQMNVTAGTAIVHVRDQGEKQSFEIDTPNVAVLLQSPGDYRVEVNEAGDSTVVKVSDGEAQVSAAGQTVPLHTQQAFAFRGTDQVTADAASVGAPDALDSWSIERDHRWDQAQARTSQYVAPDVAGATDLADYGTWESTPEYGDVWVPTTVVAGWSPYQFGRWVWVSPWGWTWVDDAPWGFAPFHYGRWAYRDTRWCWVPGPRRLRPVYAPALVAWVGSPGASVSISVGGGAGVGWFPLAPREVFVPGYRVSRDYVRNVNISNTTIVNNTYITNVYENRVANITYANRNRPGAVVAVPQTVFTSARPVSGNTMRIPQSELNRYGVRGEGPAIAPVRESVLGRRPDMNVSRPPAAFVNRPVVVRTAPPPAPVSFERQQVAIRENGSRPLGRAQMTALQPSAAANPRVRVVAPGPVMPIQSGQRLGTARPDQPGAADGSAQGGISGSTVRPDMEKRASPNLRDRERALHATPIPPAPQQNALRSDRPLPPPPMSAEPNDRSTPTNRTGTPENGSFSTNRAANPGFRNDRPPQSQMRQNDQYRMQNTDESRRQAQDLHPVPEARPIEPQRAVPQARPFEQSRPLEPPRAVPQAAPAAQPRPVEQERPFGQQRQIEQQQRVAPQVRPVEQPRAEFREPEPQRAIPPPMAQPRAEARPMEVPRAAPPQPQARAAPPAAQPRVGDGRGRPPERGDPRTNQR